MEIPLIGFADVKRWNTPLFDPWIPQEFSPQSIFPGSQSVIVIGLPVHLPVLETSPSIWYRELYKTINSLLDQYTYRIASLLNERGHPSVSVPRDGYGSIKVLKKNPITFFSHRHAAALAGLGTFGTNNMVLTPDYGPRVRFASVFTQACLKADPIMTNNLCIRCNQCVSMCPVQAIEEGTYPQAITDKRACANYSADLNHHYISPCGICIKVCPVGADRSKFGREDPGIYDPGNEHDLKKGWNHVRQYGRM
jgi:epoxyqueuosine reductase QueG